MPSLLDVLFLALFLLFVIRGYRRGLVHSLLGVGRLVLAVLLTVALATPVARLLDTAIIRPPVQTCVGERLTSLAARTEGGVAELYASVPSPLRAHLTVGDAAVANLDEAVTRWTDTVSRALSGAVATIFATVLVFLVALVTLPWLLRLLSRVVRAIPLVSGIDRLLGLTLGGVAGVAVVALFSRFIAALLVALGRPEWVEASRVLQLVGTR